MSERYRPEVWLAASLAALGAVGCSDVRQERADEPTPTTPTATVTPSPKHEICLTLPPVGKPQARSKDDGPWAYELSRDASCSVPIYNPENLQTIAYLEPGTAFFVKCIVRGDKPARVAVTVTRREGLGSSGAINLSAEAVPQFTTGPYQPEDCPVPEPTAVASPYVT